MNDHVSRLRSALTRKPDATRVDLTREMAVALLDEIDHLRIKLDELDFLHREGGPQSVAAMEEALRLIAISPESIHLSPEQQHARCVEIARAAYGERP